MNNQFKETYNNLSAAIGYTKPLSYEEWVQLPDEHKVGALFVQFYDQITLAYAKTRTDAAIEEECVSEVLAYLTKNVYGDFVNRLHNANKKAAVSKFAPYGLKKLKNGTLVATKQNKYRKKLVYPLTFNDWDLAVPKLSIVHCENGEIIVDKIVPLFKDVQGDLMYPRMFDLSDSELINMLPESERISYSYNPESSKITEKTFKPNYMYKLAYNCIYCKSIDYVKIPTTWYNNTCSNITVNSEGKEKDVFDTLLDKEDKFESTLMSNKFWSIIENQDKSTKEVINCLLSDEEIPEYLLSESNKIINKLKSTLAEFKDYYLGA